MKPEDFSPDEIEDPFPRTCDGKLLVGEVELLFLIAKRTHALEVETREGGENFQSDGFDELPNREEP